MVGINDLISDSKNITFIDDNTVKVRSDGILKLTVGDPFTRAEFTSEDKIIVNVASIAGGDARESFKNKKDFTLTNGESKNFKGKKRVEKGTLGVAQRTTRTERWVTWNKSFIITIDPETGEEKEEEQLPETGGAKAQSFFENISNWFRDNSLFIIIGIIIIIVIIAIVLGFRSGFFKFGGK